MSFGEMSAAADSEGGRRARCGVEDFGRGGREDVA
jgi:hypothetical protein